MAAARRGAAPLASDGTVVVVGASLAGWRAVEALRNEGFTGTLVLVGAERHLPYDRPPLSKQVLAGAWPPERAVLADRAKLDAQGVVLNLGRTAVSLDAEAKTVQLDDGQLLSADGLVIATGATPRRLPGTESIDGVLVLRTLDDALELRRRVLEVGQGCRVVVIGAGFIGSEVASTCHDLGCQVDVVEALETPLEPAVGPTIGAACATLHAEHQVRLHTSTAVEAIRPAVEVGEGPAPGAGRAAVVELSDGTSLAADVVVVGIGVVPATGWLEGSGLSLDDGVRCDESLVAAPGIVAAGDLARWFHVGLDEELRVEHWQVAAEEGVAAARSLLAGPKAPAFTPVPYFWSDQYGVRIQVLGRPGPGDEVVVVDGTLESHRFVALYGRAGRLSAALAISRPRPLMAYRPLLAAGASFDEALQLSPA